MKLGTTSTICLLLLVGCGFWSVGVRGEDKLEHTKDTLATVKKNLMDGKAILIDVREKEEWDAGHLEQAILLPLSKLQTGADPKDQVQQLDKKTVIYCHCRAGRRALTAAELLKAKGYEVRPLKQGYDELLKGGLPRSR